MAIFHFTASVLSRARGHRVVASAAVQAATRLRDEHYGVVHDHTHRQGVELIAILAPDAAPDWVHEREQLWNRVEAAERRVDSQLARVLEISLPEELSQEQHVQLLRDFVGGEFVANGMIADIAIRRSRRGFSNAHLMLTLRSLTPSGFGPKMRQWNGKGKLVAWRASWARFANLHLARAGHRLRIDHRTLDAQHIELTPSRKTGMSEAPEDLHTLPDFLQARFAEQRSIKQSNGSVIIDDPAIATRALALERHSFTALDIDRYLKRRTEGEVQFATAFSAVMACKDLVELKHSDGSPAQYCSRDLLDAEASLMRRARTLAARPAVSTARNASFDEWKFSTDAFSQTSERSLHQAFAYAVAAGDFKAVALPDREAAELLAALRHLWRSRGKNVFDRVPSPDEAALAREDLLMVAGAEMFDTKSLERALAATERARAKIVLIADPVRLQTMGAFSAMHALLGVGGNAGT